MEGSPSSSLSSLIAARSRELEDVYSCRFQELSQELAHCQAELRASEARCEERAARERRALLQVAEAEEARGQAVDAACELAAEALASFRSIEAQLATEREAAQAAAEQLHAEKLEAEREMTAARNELLAERAAHAASLARMRAEAAGAEAETRQAHARRAAALLAAAAPSAGPAASTPNSALARLRADVAGLSLGLSQLRQPAAAPAPASYRARSPPPPSSSPAPARPAHASSAAHSSPRLWRPSVHEPPLPALPASSTLEQKEAELARSLRRDQEAWALSHPPAHTEVRRVVVLGVGRRGSAASAKLSRVGARAALQRAIRDVQAYEADAQREL